MIMIMIMIIIIIITIITINNFMGQGESVLCNFAERAYAFIDYASKSGILC